MAAPHVSGTAALLLTHNRKVKPSLIRKSAHGDCEASERLLSPFTRIWPYSSRPRLLFTLCCRSARSRSQRGSRISAFDSSHPYSGCSRFPTQAQFEGAGKSPQQSSTRHPSFSSRCPSAFLHPHQKYLCRLSQTSSAAKKKVINVIFNYVIAQAIKPRQSCRGFLIISIFIRCYRPAVIA